MGVKGKWPSADSAADSAVLGRQGSMEAALPTVGSRHAQPGNHGTSLSDPAAALANESSHMVEHLYQVPPDGSDALLAQTCSASWRHERELCRRHGMTFGTQKLRAGGRKTS